MDIDDIAPHEPALYRDTNITATEISRASDAPHPLELPSLPEPSLALSLPPSILLTGSDEQIHMDEMIVKLCEEQLQLRSERLFAGTAGTKLDKIAFLMYPPSQVTEITLITRLSHAISKPSARLSSTSRRQVHGGTSSKSLKTG